MYSFLIHLIISLLWLTHLSPLPQTESLILKMRRDWGYAAGVQMQGRFSMTVDAPEDIQRVEFLIDGQVVNTDTEAPFSWQFQTESYSLGVHTLNAIGYGEDGRILPTQTITREFVSPQSVGKVMAWIIIPLVALILIAGLVTNWIATRGQPKTGQPAISGILGGTICPRCGRPYAIHIWSGKFVVARLDRCPHCGKWAFVNRMPQEMLEAAARSTTAESSPPPDTPANNEDALRRHLDDSRYDS